MSSVSRRRKPKKVVSVCEFCGQHHGKGSPWFNEAKDGWAVSYRDETGKQRNRLLAKGWEGHDAALRQFASAMNESKPVIAPPDGEQTTCRQVIAAYLGKLEASGSASFYNYKSTLTRVAEAIGSLTVAELRKQGGVARVQEWIDASAKARGWSDGQIASVSKTIHAAFNYAAMAKPQGLGLLVSNPVRGLNRGANKKHHGIREAVFTREQEGAILANCSPAFGVAFRVLLATGCRPSEFCRLTAADIRTDPATKSIYWLVNHKNQAHWKGQKRRVYLTPEAEQLTREGMAAHPTGPIFRLRAGGWDKNKLAAELRKVCATTPCQSLGLDDYTPRQGSERRSYQYVVYTCRHTKAHRLLTGYGRTDGVRADYGQVGQLLGDSARQIEATYGHLDKATSLLQFLVG